MKILEKSGNFIRDKIYKPCICKCQNLKHTRCWYEDRGVAWGPLIFSWCSCHQANRSNCLHIYNEVYLSLLATLVEEACCISIEVLHIEVQFPILHVIRLIERTHTGHPDDMAPKKRGENWIEIASCLSSGFKKDEVR